MFTSSIIIKCVKKDLENTFKKKKRRISLQEFVTCKSPALFRATWDPGAPTTMPELPRKSVKLWELFQKFQEFQVDALENYGKLSRHLHLHFHIAVIRINDRGTLLTVIGMRNALEGLQPWCVMAGPL